MSTEFHFDPDSNIWIDSLETGLINLEKDNPNPTPGMIKIIEERKKYIEMEKKKVSKANLYSRETS